MLQKLHLNRIVLPLCIIGLPAISFAGAALFSTCQTLGHSLYFTCVVNPPKTKEEFVVCHSKKVSYEMCLIKLNRPYPLTKAIDPDLYVYSLFSPCKYETSHLVMHDICVKL
jgi:hypothetical protein